MPDKIKILTKNLGREEFKMEIKLVIADQKSGKCIQKSLDDSTGQSIYNLKIGSVFKGELINLPGYEFEITGGSDDAGFPMHKSINTARRYKLLTYPGVGFRGKGDYKKKGLRLRKTVAGNMVHEKTTQVNVKIIKMGSESLFNSTEEKKE